MDSAATLIPEQQEIFAISSLANLSRSRQRVLDEIEAIAMSLSGSDEVAVYEVDRTRTRLDLVAASGIDGHDMHSIPMGSGVIGRAAANGSMYERFFEPEASLDGERHLRACIPLKMDRTTVGVVAIFDSHGHYLVQPPLNREWLENFAGHAAHALHWTGIYESAIATLNSEW